MLFLNSKTSIARSCSKNPTCINTTYIVMCYFLVDINTRNIYIYIYIYIHTLALFKPKLEPGYGIVSTLRPGASVNLIGSEN